MTKTKAMITYIIEYSDGMYAGTVRGDFMRTKKITHASVFCSRKEAKDFINKFAPLSKELPYKIVVY